jgi:hypothetical protein
MFVTLINDCRDANAFGRQSTRTASLFGLPVLTVGVRSDLEAAGNLIDALDASEGREGVILVNVAPRNGDAKKWPNGTPFGWFLHGKTVVVSSIDGLTLSLAKKLGVVESVRVFDIPTVVGDLARRGVITLELANRIAMTQFRSLEFLPRAAKWLADGIELPAERLNAADIEDAPAAVWWVDNFGNCKTTVTADELSQFTDDEAFTGLSALPLHSRLKDVADGEAAFVVGSSGIGEKRFVEVVIQGGDAASRFGLKTGKALRRPVKTRDGARLPALA